MKRYDRAFLGFDLHVVVPAPGHDVIQTNLQVGLVSI